MVSRIWSKSFFDRGSIRDEVKAVQNVLNDTYLPLRTYRKICGKILLIHRYQRNMRKDSLDPTHLG
jgi:hypothetical protein